MRHASILALMICFFSALAGAVPTTLTVFLSEANSDQANLQLLEQQLTDQAATQVVYEFVDSSALTYSNSSYSRSYPNGDLYYLIGDLSPTWGKSDYARFYNIAKILEKMGFRTIVNVAASTADLREAARNSQTSAIIWNSHGADDGTIFDIKDQEVPTDAFNKGKSASLRFVLFANCYGYRSIDYYHLGGNTTGVGWQGETDSDQFFGYLRSKDFIQDLKKAFGKSLRKK